jgi:hypothetical protein
MMIGPVWVPARLISQSHTLTQFPSLRTFFCSPVLVPTQLSINYHHPSPFLIGFAWLTHDLHKHQIINSTFTKWYLFQNRSNPQQHVINNRNWWYIPWEDRETLGARRGNESSSWAIRNVRREWCSKLVWPGGFPLWSPWNSVTCPCLKGVLEIRVDVEPSY